MREYSVRAVDAAELLRHDHERLTSELAELETLRVRVHEAEQKLKRASASRRLSGRVDQPGPRDLSRRTS